MSDTPAESTPAVDLTDLRLTPQWVADFGKQQPLRTYADEEANDRPRRRDDGGRSGGRPPAGRPSNRSGAGGGGGGGGAREFRPGPRPPGGGAGGPPQGDRRRDGRGDPRRGGGDRGRDRDRDHAPRQEPAPQLVGLTTMIEPDNRAVEAMTQMIRTAGKAFSVFDAAKLVLTSNDRFDVKFALAATSHEKLHTVPADGSLWLTRDEAVAHLMQGDVLQQFYKTEEIELEEPKGNFTSVATCGFSGELLGPPNHHSYQAALHRLHRERFFNIPFEDYKRRVRTDATPEAVEKWKESQKHGTQWIDLKAEVPEGGEPPRFKTRAEMETHFRTHYAPSMIGEASEATVAGNIPRKHLSGGLFNALRNAVDEARKHLLPLAQRLCASFEHHGLKLFKRRGGKLWVSRTRPRLLDSHIVLSDRIAKMVAIIKDKPGIPVKNLLAILAPQAEPEKAAPAPAPAAEKVLASEAPAEATAPVAEAAAPAPAVQGPPDERLEALKDLHWLNSEGYIIEYSDGVVFPGVTEPPPAKPKPVKEKPSPTAEATEAAVEEVSPSSETETETEEATAEAPAEEPEAAADAVAPETPAEEPHHPTVEDFITIHKEGEPVPAVTAEPDPAAAADHVRHMD